MVNTDHRNLIAINDFRNPQEYVYNADLVEFTQFGVKLRDLVPPGVVAGATFTKDYFLNYSNPGLFAVPFIFGTVTIEKERLALIGGMFNKQWTLPLDNKTLLGTAIPQGTISFTYYPNYSNCPKTTQHIFTFGRIDNEDEKKNLIEIEHTSTGDFLFNLYDRVGNQSQTKITKIIEYADSPISFCLSYNAFREDRVNESQIALNIFMEGKSVVRYYLDVESFDIDKIREISFGNMIGSFKPNFAIKNFVYQNECIVLSLDEYLETEDKLFPLPETRYTTDPQKCEYLFSVCLEQLKDIKVVSNESDEIDRGFYVAYTFKIDEVEWYFDRTDFTWKVHTSPEQISDLGYMMTYKDLLLGDKQGVEFKCIPYLRTIKGDKTPSIVSQIITYDEYIKYEEAPPTALVYGYVRDALGNFIKNAKVVITPSRASVAETGNFILPKMTQSVRTGNNGYWDIQLPLSTNFSPEVLYNFQILFRDQVVYEKANLRIMKEGTVRFEDLVKQPPIPPYPPGPTPPCPPCPPIDPDHYIHGMIWQEIGNVEPDNPDHQDEDFNTTIDLGEG